MYRLNGVILGSWPTGKLGCAWVSAWVVVGSWGGGNDGVAVMCAFRLKAAHTFIQHKYAKSLTNTHSDYTILLLIIA